MAGELPDSPELAVGAAMILTVPIAGTDKRCTHARCRVDCRRASHAGHRVARPSSGAYPAVMAGAMAAVHSSPDSLILVGAASIVVAAAVARCWRPIARGIRPTNRGPQHLSWMFGTDDEPRGWFVFTWAAGVGLVGFGFLITGLNRL